MAQDSKISKKSWKIDEDARLLQLVSEYGLNGHWTTISSKMGNRTGKQCRERYHNHLKPDICKDAWTQEEDDVLNQAQKDMGNQWAKIAKLLPGRSDNSVKNRWHIINRNKPIESSVSTHYTCKVSTRPFVPKLPLNLVGGISSVTSVQVPPCVTPEYDLLSCYYSHDSHGHYHQSDGSRAGTGRNDFEICPGSGRRDLCATESASGEEDEEDEFSQFDAYIDGAMKEECFAGVVSFNNTLSTCISDITCHSEEFDEPSLETDGDDELDAYEIKGVANDQIWEDTLCRFRCASAIEMCTGDDAAVQESIDRFSEPAMSFRDMDSVLDDLAQDDQARDEQDEDNDDYFAVFDNLMDANTCANTLQNASPFRKTSSQDVSRFVTHLQRKLSPRTTPRSPVYPTHTVKKQRATRTPRSPYQLVSSMLGRI